MTYDRASSLGMSQVLDMVYTALQAWMMHQRLAKQIALGGDGAPGYILVETANGLSYRIDVRPA